jgi:adenine specific DNA methylase Mod/very-short-patch-repair endonuclease
MTKEQKFYKALEDVFIGAKIEGEGGFINLMRIKSNYYSQIEKLLREDIEKALEKRSDFKDELFDKLYSFFTRYFTESGSIYFNSTPFHNNIYEKVYTDDRDVILFWKTQMLYYVKTDRIFRSMPIEIEGVKFRFDASTIENKKANEKRSLIYELKDMEDDKTIIFSVYYSEKGRKTKEDDILKEIKKRHISITEEQLEKAFRVFEKQSEVDFFINKNARQFLQEQFKLWSYQYFWDGASYWTQDRINQLQILKDVAFKIIDFISQFEDELVKIWNKPKFVLNSNYVITLDRIMDTALSENQIPLAPFNKGGIDGTSSFDEGSNPPPPFTKISNPPAPFNKGGSRGILIKILNHPNIDLQIKEWKELGIVDEDFTVEDIFEDEVNNNWEERKSPGLFDKNELKQRGLITTGFHLPYNPDLKERARELRKNMTEPEKKIWYEYLRNFKYQVLRQKPLDNYIVDFYCPELKLVIEIDGDTHFTEDRKVYDEERTRILEGYGLKIIRFLNTDIMRNLAGVVQEIEKEIHQIPPAPFNKGGISVSSSIEVDATVSPFTKGELRGICPKYKHLPIDTKYFKDLELEILSLFDDLDNQLDGWLIKSENYQALNTILSKFREKVQTIYIDPPFNKEEDADYLYNIKYKDSTWASILENRLWHAKDLLSGEGSIFVRCDYNGNWIVRCLLNQIINQNNNSREIILRKANSQGALGNFNPANESLFFHPKNDIFVFNPINKDRNREIKWVNCLSPKENKEANTVVVKGKIYKAPKNQHWRFSQTKFDYLDSLGRLRINEKTGIPQYLESEEVSLDTNWTDVQGYSFINKFQTENAEVVLQRVIDCSSKDRSIIFDFFLGSGTTTAVAHKLGRKWLGVEMGEHFYTVILPRMKKVLFYDKSGISKEVKEYQGGGFFKYYELEQYEDTLRNCKYEDGDLLAIPDRSPYQEYVFLKDEKLLKSLYVDYENNKVNIDLTKLYENIDIPETLSNLMGKWIKKITAETVIFEDGNEINYKDLDYKQIKPLIWW